MRFRILLPALLTLLGGCLVTIGPPHSTAAAACPQPALRQMPAGDAASDAAGTGQWFDVGAGAEIPNLVDFNADGFLDILLTRTRGPVDQPGPGNSLLLSQGAFDVFKDVAPQMGVGNVQAYNRQSSISDVDGDGFLDIAIGADNINNATFGVPEQRLYVYQAPPSGVFEDGRFIDLDVMNGVVTTVGG